MAQEPTLGPLTLPHFLVKQLKPEKHGVTEEDLATKIQEIEIQTQIAGASFIKVHVIDPDWTIITSGLIKVSEDGLLTELEVEFPEHSKYFWTLCAMEGSTELSMANLVLTFEDRIVSRLRQQWGHLTAKTGTSTRAQFVKQLVEQANLKEHLKIRFVSPGINRVEPVAESKPAKTKTAAAKSKALENKERGIHAGAEFKIKGQAPSSIQRAILNEVLGVAAELSSPQLATEALIEACITENTVSNSGAGLLQFETSTASSIGVTKGNIKSEVTAFLTKSYSRGTLEAGKGGAIEYANKHPNAPAYEVAQATQGSGAGEASKGSANYGPFRGEAQEIIQAFGGINAGGTKKHAGESDIGQLSRGTVSNPDEDSWDCMTRLAQEVAWNVFTDGKNTVFYMDGPDFIAQRPVCYINPAFRLPTGEVTSHVIKEDHEGGKIEEFGALMRPLSFTYDNTAFLYRATHKVKGKIQRKSRIAKPQTPSEIRLEMLCGMTEFRAGDVFVFSHCGPISENGGRWIVSDATRETMKYPYTKFILVPPTEPLPEPKAATETPAGTEVGNALAAFEASSTLSQFQLPYVWGGGHSPKALEAVKRGGPGLDCSGSVCWVLWKAGMFKSTEAVVSGELETFGEAGEGREMTVWSSASHTFIEFNVIGHERAQMNTNGPQNGPRLYTLSQTATYNPSPKTEGYTPRHYAGT